MKLLFSYLKVYWKLVALALVLATINQVFSLLDPYIFKHVIDDYVTQFGKHDKSSFFRGVGLLLLAALIGSIILIIDVNKSTQSNVVFRRLSRSDNFIAFFK